MTHEKTAIIYLLVLSVLFSAFPVALGEDEAELIVIGSGMHSHIIIPSDEQDYKFLNLNGVPYQPELTPKGDFILLTADLLCADEARHMIDEGNYAASDFVIGGGEIIPASDAVITMEDVNEFFGLLDKYRHTSIPSGAKGDLIGLLDSYTWAQNCKGTQEEADALYILSIKNILVHYSYLNARMAEAENEEQKAALDTLLNDPRLKALLTKFETHIDKGIYHEYKPSLAAALGIEGNKYILESGGTVSKKLIVEDVWVSPMTAENGYPCPGCGDIPCTCRLPEGWGSTARSDEDDPPHTGDSGGSGDSGGVEPGPGVTSDPIID